MLNKDEQRELAYVVIIDNITPIPGYDRVELAHVGGWTIVVGKGEFQPGDPAIYFEIDSKLPEVEPFTKMEFLVTKHYKIKTQRMCKCISQGLLMSAENFGWDKGIKYIKDSDGNFHSCNDESRFLTKQLGVTYAVQEDNERKSSDPNAKYKSMAARHPGLFQKKPIRWLYKKEWGKKLLFLFFGKKKDNNNFPNQFQYVKKTDEDRCENMPWILSDKRIFLSSEKVDGTSSTYLLSCHKGMFKTTYEFYVCSRNRRIFKPDQETYHEQAGGRKTEFNVYWDNAFKYDIKQHLKDYLIKNNLDYVCIQGESVGPDIQGNPLKLPETDLYVFNFIRSDIGRISSIKGKDIIESWGMKWVPLLDLAFRCPDTMEEMKTLADGKSKINPVVDREGIVYSEPIDGNVIHFKNVSNKYLLKQKDGE